MVAALVALHLTSFRTPPAILTPSSQPLSSLRSLNGLSDIGRLRQRNEDSLALRVDSGVAVIADGMGGHPGGDVASSIATAAAAEILTRAASKNPNSHGFASRMRAVMVEAVVGAHRSIRERSAIEPHLDGMGTTLTAMIVHPETGTWVIGHVGDSRAYRIHGDTMDQMTRDDTWIQQQIEQNPDLNPARVRNSPYAHLLTQCLGLENQPSPQIVDGTAESGDRFLLCSDGLVGMLEDDTVLSILTEALPHAGTDLDMPIRKLLEAANEAGGRDNITAALVQFENN